MQHERATRTFIKQKAPSFLHHPHHGTHAHHVGMAAGLASSLHHHHHHSHPSSLQGPQSNGDVGHNTSSGTNLTGLPMNNATAAAILAAHGHHSAIAGHFSPGASGTLHHQASHLIGNGGGLLPQLPQYNF